jgi:hypothetical protein
MELIPTLELGLFNGWILLASVFSSLPDFNRLDTPENQLKCVRRLSVQLDLTGF